MVTMTQTSTDVRSRLSNAELEELYCRRLRTVQNINRNDPTRYRVVHNRSVGLPNDSSLPLNAFNIDESWTSKINPTPRQNPKVDLSSTQQHVVGNLGLVPPPFDVQSTHPSFYQGTACTIIEPRTLPNQQSRIAASYPMYPLTDDSSLPLNAFYIDDSRTSKISPAPPQNPMVDLSSTHQHAVGKLGLGNPPIDVQSTHPSFYQGTVGTLNAPTMLPNQQSRIAASYPLYPLTQGNPQDNPRPLFDYSPDEVNWSTYVPLIRNKPNVIGPIIPPRYWRTPVYNPIVNEETGPYNEMEGVYGHFNNNSVNYYKYANRNNNGNEHNNNNGKNKIM